MALDQNASSAPPAPFVWGPGGQAITPQALENRRALALAMLKQGSDYSPIQSPWQGVARVTDAIMGGYRANKLDQQEYGARQASAAQNAQLLSSILGGGQGANPYGGAAPASSPTADASPAPTTSVAGGAGGSAPDMSGNDIYSGFMDTVKGGITNPAALAAVAATGKSESSFDPSKAYGSWADPSQSGEAGTSGGVMSWRGPRFQAMRQFAAANGGDPNKPSPQLQAQFFLQENPALIQQLNAAKSPAEAQQLMNNAWKFAGYDQPGGEAGRRIALANNYASQFSGGAPQVVAAANAEAGGGLPQQAPIPMPSPGADPSAPVQTASLDPSAGMPPAAPAQSGAPQGAGAPGEVRLGADGKPYQFAQTTGMAGATGDSGWIPVNPAAVGATPLPASPAAPAGNGPAPLPDAMFNARAGGAAPPPMGMPVSPDTGPAAAFAPGGGVLPQSAPTPTGRDAVLQAMGGAPAAPAAPASIPQYAPPAAPQGGAAQVAAAMAGQPQGQAPAAPMGGVLGNNRSGIDPRQIAAISQGISDPWASEGQQQLLGSVLSSRLTPHKIEMVPLGDGSTAEIDSITGQQVGTVKGVRPPILKGYDQQLVDPSTGQPIGGGQTNGELPFRFMTQDEKQAAGLPLDTPVQIGPDGKMVSNGVTVNTGTPQGQYSDEMAKGLSGPHLALENGVEAAQEQQRDIHAMQQAIQTIKQNGGTTGLGQPEIMKLQSLVNTGANALGMDEPFDISDKEFLTKFNRQIAGAQAKSAAGARVTNFELKNYLSANPGLEMSQNGNERLLGIQNQILQRNIDVGQALRDATARAVSQGRKVNPAENEQLIRDYDAAHHIVDPVTGQDLTKDVKLKDEAQPNAPSAGTGRPRATNPQTGATVEWDGTNWVPVK